MKTNRILLITGSLVVSFFLWKWVGCNKPKSTKTIEVHKVETLGDWETVEDVIEERPVDSEHTFTISDIISERDLYFERYQVYKLRSIDFEERANRAEMALLEANSSEEAVIILKNKIEVLEARRKRDSTLIATLFADLDKEVEPASYTGVKEGDNWKTSVEVTSFGIIPEDGINIKTDVTCLNTKEKEVIEVPKVKRHSAALYGGLDFSDLEYLLGIEYERQFEIFNGSIGPFIQGDYKPNKKEVGGRAGLRAHF